MSRVLNKIMKFRPTFLKKKWIPLLLLVLVGATFLPQPAEAGLFGMIGGKLKAFGQNMVNALIKAVGSIIIAIVSPFLLLSKHLLIWVTSDAFISAGYLPSNNEVVAQGWTVVRNFANMFFVVGLIVIALATALRFKEYQAQKLLPKLLIIALLINFTPVIAGIIIDASNIAMDYFLSEVNLDQGVVSHLIGDQKEIWGSWSNTSIGQTFGKTAMLVVFQLVVTSLYFLYAFLFAVRPLALWILIILSPLAFLAFIFPSTKQYWDQWWNQFFQWCFVGVIGAMFLFFGHQIIGSGLIEGYQNTGAENIKHLSTFFDYIAGYAVPIVFMFIGFILSVKTSAIGADSVINAGKHIGKTGAAAVAGGSIELSQRTMNWSEDRVEGEEMEDMWKPRELTAKAANKFRDTIGAAKEGTKKSRVAGWASKYTPETMKKAGKAIGGATGIAAKRKAKELAQNLREEGGMPTEKLTKSLLSATEQTRQAENEADNRTDEENADVVKNKLGSLEDRAASLVALTRNGNLELAKKKFGVDKEDIAEITRGALKKGNIGQVKDIVNSNIDLAPEIAEGFDQEKREKVGLTVSDEEIKDLFTKEERRQIGKNNSPEEARNVYLKSKLAAEASKKDIENWSEDIMDDSAVMHGIHLSSPQTWSKLGQEFGRKASQKLNSGMKARGPDWYKDHDKGNLVDYSTSSGARSVGLINLKDVNEKNTKKKEDLIKEFFKETSKQRSGGANYTGGVGKKSSQKSQSSKGSTYNSDKSSGKDAS